MTAKRFKLGYVCGDYGLIDNDEWIDLHSMSENSEKNIQICINKMNDLAEENDELKLSNINLEAKVFHLIDILQEKGSMTYEEVHEWWNSEVMK